MLCNCLCISPCYVIVVIRCCWGIVFVLLGCCSDVVLVFNCFEFHHAVQLFVNFTMLCNSLWISSFCAIVCEFQHVVFEYHHIVELFVNFIILCNCLWISTCYAFVVMCCCCCWCVEVLLRCCCGIVEVMLWCCCYIVVMLLWCYFGVVSNKSPSYYSKKSIILFKEVHHSSNRAISRVATATKNKPKTIWRS